VEYPKGAVSLNGLALGWQYNQSLQQMKPPVTSLAGASAAPDVFTAEARC
jgi:hypothetical protein